MKLDLNWMERIITYKSLTDEEYLSTIVDYIKPEYFENKGLHFVFDVVRDFYVRRKTLPRPSEIRAYLETSEQKEIFKRALTEANEVEKSLNKDELYANTERFIKERGIYNTIMNVAKDISSGEFDTGKILDQFEKTCNITLEHDIGIDLFPQFERVKKGLLEKQSTISSGYKWLDERLGGGFVQNGRAMYIFAGETNIGKSIILSNCAVNAARQKKTVLIVSLEMSEEMYARRIIASISSTSVGALADDIDVVQAKVENFYESTGGRIIIKEFPPSLLTPGALMAFIKKLEKKGVKIDMIVLDYINLLTTTKGNSGYEKLKYIAEETRALTYVFSCPLITVTQMNRTGYSVAEPGLTALSESYAVGATADFVASLWQAEGDNELGILRTSLLKNRFGRNFGSYAFKIDYPTLTISENEVVNSLSPETIDGSRMLAMLSS